MITEYSASIWLSYHTLLNLLLCTAASVLSALCYWNTAKSVLSNKVLFVGTFICEVCVEIIVILLYFVFSISIVWIPPYINQDLNPATGFLLLFHQGIILIESAFFRMLIFFCVFFKNIARKKKEVI